jgi:translation initiation factor IF-3
MNWTVGERDMQLQAARLAEFLEAGFRVTLNLVQPRRRAPVGPERAQEIVEGVREAVKGVLGVSVAESVTGTLGKTMMMEFRPAGVLGQKKNEKAFTVQMPINSVALETKLTEIKAALRKGVNVEVKVEEPEPDAKTKSSLSEQEIWQRIRTVVRGVKDAVETNIKDSDARSKLFKAEYTKADLPRIIEIESDLGANMLDVRGQWVSTWLQQGIPVRIFVHGKQHEASGANSPEVVERSETQLQRLINAVQAAGQRPLISTKDEETEGSEFGEWYSLALAAKEVEIEPPRPQIKASKQPIQWQQPQKNHQPHMNRSYEDILHSMSQSAGNG